jgi:hypothetical protein
MSKLKMWNAHPSWEEAEAAWDAQACQAAKQQPIRKLHTLPSMPGITEETAKNLKWKSLKWMVAKDKDHKVLKGMLKHPIKYGLALLRSALKQKPYLRDKDFFYYGIQNLNDFSELLSREDTLLVVGFSYCHKPFECPSGRFTENCMHDAENLVCQQCFIGKCIHSLPETNVIPLMIPTIHYIGAQIFDVVHGNPDKQVIFMITACEMTLEMFGDWGNMVGIKGIGVRLDGRICNTMKAFELSEEGIKPGLTVVLDDTQGQMLDLIKKRRSKEKIRNIK